MPQSLDKHWNYSNKTVRVLSTILSFHLGNNKQQLPYSMTCHDRSKDSKHQRTEDRHFSLSFRVVIHHHSGSMWGWYLKDEGKLYKIKGKSMCIELENICGTRTSCLVWLEIFKCRSSVIVFLDSYSEFKVIAWLNATRWQCLSGLIKMLSWWCFIFSKNSFRMQFNSFIGKTEKRYSQKSKDTHSAVLLSLNALKDREYVSQCINVFQ